MRKSFLEKRKQRLEAKRSSLRERALASNDVNEVRSLNADIEELNQDIAEVDEELRMIAEEERQAQEQGEQRNMPPANAQLVNGGIVGSFTQNATQ